MARKDNHHNTRMEEYKKNPLANSADAMNHSHAGDLTQLTRSGGCLTRIIVITIFIIVLYFIMGPSS